MKSISEFLEELSRSDDEMDIVVFFHNNQFAMDTGVNIARWIKKDYNQIKDKLEHLVSLGVLEKMGTGSSAIYSYTQNVEKIKILDKFIKLTKEKLRP
jgi:predicted transcriptional regulator